MGSARSGWDQTWISIVPDSIWDPQAPWFCTGAGALAYDVAGQMTGMWRYGDVGGAQLVAVSS
jgi:hypothetical protein